MPRAKRTYLPGLLWHLTQRCHNRQFLLGGQQERKNWLYWMRLASHRFNLTILNYMVTSNHIHLVVLDDGQPKAIARCMHLASGLTAKQYNSRRRRHGSFWEDRYHATAVDSDVHFVRCMFYVDLNMVRAGVVSHPIEWEHCGFQEITGMRQRYQLINRQKLCCLLAIAPSDLARSYGGWIEDYMKEPHLEREGRWTESLAVGRREFVVDFKDRLGFRAKYREVTGLAESFELREDRMS